MSGKTLLGEKPIQRPEVGGQKSEGKKKKPSKKLRALYQREETLYARLNITMALWSSCNSKIILNQGEIDKRERKEGIR